MSHILGIKFRDHGQVYYFDSGPFVVELGDSVLVQTEQGLGMGKVTVLADAPPPEATEQEIKPIFRLPTPEDLDIQRENDALAREAHTYCRKCIESRNLEMKLVDVEVLHDRGKIVFYFTAPGRIDFRELVKDLVKAYHTRIELRQIGVRHETQMLGAIGNCGQMCCCRRFMRKFAPVTIKMAKEQNLFLNPTKISGICGRLLCCLSFEQENYEQFQKKCPRVGKKFSTSLGLVKVLRTNLFRETVTVLDEAGEEHELTVEEWSAAAEARPPLAEGQPGPKAEERPAQDSPRPPQRRSGPPAGSQGGRERPGGRPEGRDRQRPQCRPGGPAPEPAAPELAAAAPSGPAVEQAQESRPEREPGRGSRRSRRPSRRNSRPSQPAGDQSQRQAGPRPAPRPDGRHGGGKPSSRDPETGS
ncbi:regulatory iron-sulfur-containing complex subunit RicT [Solidesulfovibrio sp.]|uniref:regulatory iron-sulfur-containing complex subunit RicT n=1 Tax=Solidesulfovibrio sp. TaxID=2910990 RepID=UPI00262FD4F0|nr:regulatory iron-sulfur-containing complex subunit RicT [Solidesulfovibrio sp.]